MCRTIAWSNGFRSSRLDRATEQVLPRLRCVPDAMGGKGCFNSPSSPSAAARKDTSGYARPLTSLLQGCSAMLPADCEGATLGGCSQHGCQARSGSLTCGSLKCLSAPVCTFSCVCSERGAGKPHRGLRSLRWANSHLAGPLEAGASGHGGRVCLPPDRRQPLLFSRGPPGNHHLERPRGTACRHGVDKGPQPRPCRPGWIHHSGADLL